MNQQIDQKIVGQIISAIGMLHIFPSEEKTGEFLSSLFADIPGCLSASLCTRRTTNPIGGTKGEQCRDCAGQREQPADANHYLCGLAEQDNVRAYPLETTIQLYGYLVLNVEDVNEYLPYEPFVKNIGNALAITLENRWQQAELKNAQQNLEEKIEQRTNELFAANKSLKKEIAERKRMEKEILQGRAEFEAIFLSITDAIVFTDQQRRIIMVNPAFTKMLGYQLEEVAGQTTQIIYADPDAYSKQGKVRFQPKAKIESPVFENEYRRKDGTVFQSETLGVHVKNQHGEIIGFLGVIRDITDRKKAEEEKANLETHLRQAYKMEAVGTMAGGIAHDFNNILAIILGNADMALDDIPDGNPARMNINQVLKASNRAKDLVRQILSFSRKADQELLPIKPGSAIKESLKLLRSTTPTTVSIVQNICADCGTIMADPTQLHQLLMNLCSNAVHAMDEKGTLEVVGERVDLEADDIVHQPGLKPGQYLKLSVRDTGMGMNRETRERIFDPFYTTKEVNEGTGMGLSIVMGIVQNHGGMITVDSEPGEGTTFHIFFPIVKKEEIRKIEVSEQLPQGNERILFVDDEEMLATLGSRMLEKLGYRVKAETSSNVALETFVADPDNFDLVITDQTMPDMSGAELAAELLKIRPDIPIILCTGFSKKISEDKAREMGIREFCIKPLDRKSLAKTVRKVLGENKA